MKKLGLIGGIGPESTVKYYQMIVTEFRKRLETQEYPEFTIRSINMTRMLSYVFKNDPDGLVNFLLEHLQELEETGATFAALASNTPHLVFEDLKERSNLPLISIVEETCKRVQEKDLSILGLFGTRSTMEAGFYQQVLERYGIKVKVPHADQRAFIHEKYFGELVFNQINPDTKEQLIQIAVIMKEEDAIQGLILGGTELSLILDQDDFQDLKVFDTTRIHVDAIVNEMIGD